jgi:hypothetical protein
MSHKTTYLATIATLSALAGLTFALQGGAGPPQPVGGGDLEACDDDAPGDDRSFKVKDDQQASGDPGNIDSIDKITITTMVGNPPVAQVDTYLSSDVPPSFTVDDTNPNEPEVTLNNPPNGPGKPAAGAEVCVEATTANEGTFDGLIEW